MVGERLSELRKDRGLKQKELADKLGISVHTISSYERNLSTPDDEMKIRIAKFFGVSVDYLLGTTQNQSPCDNTLSRLIIVENLPPVAVKELDTFLVHLKNKYKL
ncbi:MAG: helix-turn-helix transcriptional regulator [Clostridia bacterium]|nr:helix-turn-helix transcriptional regulator [Clostridia bacterium]